MNEVNTVRRFDSLHQRPLHLFEGSDTELTSRCISVFSKATLVRQCTKKKPVNLHGFILKVLEIVC